MIFVPAEATVVRLTIYHAKISIYNEPLPFYAICGMWLMSILHI